METISFEDFKKIEIRIGKIISAQRVETSNKLLKLEVDFGPSEKDSSEKEVRQILAGIAKFYTPEQIIGKQCPFLVNLEPRKMMGLESQGMMLASGTEESIVILHPEKEVPNGSGIK